MTLTLVGNNVGIAIVVHPDASLTEGVSENSVLSKNPYNTQKPIVTPITAKHICFLADLYLLISIYKHH